MDQPDPMRYQMLAAQLGRLEERMRAMERAVMPVGDQLVSWQRADINTWAAVTNASPMTDYSYLPLGYVSGDVLVMRTLFRLQAPPSSHGTVRFRITDAVKSTTFDLSTAAAPSPGQPTYWWIIECAWLHPWRCFPNDMREQLDGSGSARLIPARTFLSFQVGGVSGSWAGAVMSPWTGKFTGLESAPTATTAGTWAIVS